MLTIDRRYAVASSIAVRLIVCCTIMLAAGWSLSDSAAYGATTQCEYSLQLQKSPYREEYIAKLATEVGNFWASNEDSAVASDADDEFSFFSISGTSSGNNLETVIDSFSRNCLTCHDGSRATDISVDFRNNPGNPIKYSHVSKKDHPIGMDYASYVSFGGGKYKPITALNSKMVFIDGKVGCLTCHNPLNPEKSHLVMSDFRSALCLSCHDK